MRTTRRTLIPILTAAVSAALLTGVLAAPTSATVAPVAAVEADDHLLPDDLPEIGETFDPGGDVVPHRIVCSQGLCRQASSAWDDRDRDGKLAWARLSNASDRTEFYQVYFDPYGEQLILWDRWSDGYRARADVVVYDPSGAVIDRDSNLFTSYTGEFDLGTPDGSGDITERLRVAIRVCRAGTTTCSPWATGLS